MEDARDARIVLVERETIDLLFGEGIFRARRTQPPDLVLIDVARADPAPYATLRRLRNDWRLRHVPVVFLCASETEGERAMSGADRPNAFLVKPVRREAFQEVLRQLRNWSLRLDLPEDPAYRIVRWPFELAARGLESRA
jgi:CheY-like chemotaxis protein